MRPLRTLGLVTTAVATVALLAVPASTSYATPTPAPGPDIPVIATNEPTAAARTDTIIVTFDHAQAHPGSAASAAVADAAQDVAGADITKVTTIGPGIVAVTLDATLSRSEQARIGASIEAEAGVASAEADVVFQPTSTGDPTGEPFWRYLWNLGSGWGIKAPQAWSRSAGAGAVVGIVDTGVTPHPDLTGSATSIVGGSVIAGYDFITTPAVARDGNGRDADPTDLVADNNFHGTHVAGIIGARLDGKGVVGTAPEVSIQPLRAMGDGGGTSSDIMAAMRWGAGLTVPGIPANPTPADVLNLSLGGRGGCSFAMQETVNAVIAKGVVVVVSAGNEGASLATSTPANCQGVVRVTATGATGVIADYSNRGTSSSPATIAAPGGSSIPMPGGNEASGLIMSDWFSGPPGQGGAPGYAYMAGTSMAAPHVTGVVALLKAVRKELTPAQVIAILQRTATPLASPCDRAVCGAGILDAAAAVADQVPTPPAPSLSVSAGPAITGTASVAKVLTGRLGKWSKKATVRSQWLRDGAPISRAKSVRYRTTPADVGHSLAFRVTATRAGYTPAVLTSSPVVVAAGVLRLRTTPSITGRRVVGRVLTAHQGSWRTKATLHRQWLRDGQPILGATRAGWRVTAEDLGHQLSLRVTATRAGYTTAIATSSAVLIG